MFIIKEELYVSLKQKFLLPLGNIFLEIIKKSKLGEKIMAIAKDLQKKDTVNKIKKGKSTHTFAAAFLGKEMLHGNEKCIFF
jgi:hypothetical protein